MRTRAFAAVVRSNPCTRCSWSTRSGSCATASPPGAPEGRPGAAAAGVAGAAPRPPAAHADRRRSVAERARGVGAHEPAGRAGGAAALRSATTPTGVLVADRETLGLAPGVQVDRDRPGELAPGLAGDWLVGERDRHRERSSRGLAAAASALEADGDLPAAAAQARERVARDPYSESAVRELVRLTWLAGDRAGALDVYDRFRERLRSRTRRRAVAGDEAAGGRAARRRRPARPGCPRCRCRRWSSALRRSRRWSGGPTSSSPRAARTSGSARAAPACCSSRASPASARRGSRPSCATVTWWEGAAVLAGRVAEDALVPYQAWVEALDGYLAAVPPEVAAALAARDEQALARILPGVRADPAPAEDRFRLLEAVATLLGRDRPRAADGADPGRPPLGGAREPDPARPRAALARSDAPARRGHVPRVGARPRPPAVRGAGRSAPRRRRRPRAARRARRGGGRGARSGGVPRRSPAPSTGAPAATRSSRASCSATPPSRAATACRRASAR